MAAVGSGTGDELRPRDEEVEDDGEEEKATDWLESEWELLQREIELGCCAPLCGTPDET